MAINSNVQRLRDYQAEKKKKTSSNSTTNSNVQKLRDYQAKKKREEEKSFLSDRIDFDTLSTDLTSANDTLSNIYGGWQTEETMANSRSTIENMYNRLTAFKNYQSKYVDPQVSAGLGFKTTFDDVNLPVTQRGLFRNANDYLTKQSTSNLDSVINTYKTALDEWDSRTELYGGFKNADAYDKAAKQANLSKTFENLSHEDVQTKLRGYDVDSDEYKYLSGYTEYTDLNDFEFALKLKKNGMDAIKTIYDKATEYKTNASQYRKNAETYKKRSNGMTTDGGNTARAEEEEKKLAEYLKSVGYSSYEELAKEYNEKNSAYKKLETARNQYALDHTFDLYKHYQDEEDFEKNSKYVSTKMKDPSFWDKLGARYGMFYDDLNYEYINNVNGMRDEIEDTARSLHLGHTPYTSVFEEKGYHKLNPDEIAVYNYIYKTEGKEKAQAFLDEMEVTLTKRVYDEKTGEWKDFVDNGFLAGAGASALTVPANAMGSVVGLIGDVATKISGNEVNPYAGYKMYSNFASDTRQYVGENIAEATEGMELFGQNVPSFLYQTGMSILDSKLGVSTLGKAYTAIAGYSSFQQKYKEMTEAGESEDVIFKTALASGVAEALFEYVSIDKLVKIGNIDEKRKIISAALKQAGIEASEEFCTELANIISDTKLRGENSDLYKDYHDLISRGYSEKEARTEIAKKVGGQLAWAGVGGFLSGLPMGGTQAISNYRDMSKTGKTIRSNERVGDMLDIASLTPEESSAYEAYTSYANKGITADNITDAKLGNLYSSAKAEATNTLYSRKSTEEQKVKAIDTLHELKKVNTENTYKKKAKASTIEAQEKASELNVGEVTEVTATGNSTQIEGIKVEGDNVTLVTSEGEVSIDDMTFNQKDSALVGNAQQIAIEYGNDVANIFLSQYDGKTDVDAYANSFNLVTEYTSHNLTEDTILAHKGVLSTEQVKAIYQATVHQQYVNMENTINAIVEKQGKNMTIKGTFDDSIVDYNSTTTDGTKVNWNSLSERQRNAIKFARMFSKATGVNIRFIQSKVVRGKRKGKNGSYNPETNTIEIDVYAGIVDAKSVNDSIIPTLSHEITHWAKYKAPAIYDTLRNEVMSTLAESGMTSESRIDNELARLRKAHPENTYTEEDAIDEIVAKACEDMLTNSNSIRKMLNKMSAKEQKKFLAKIKETFENLMQWINDLLAQYKSGSAEAETLRGYKNKLKEISKTWDAMIEQAIVSNQALQKEGVLGETLVNGISKDGSTIVGENNLQMSDRTYREGGREFLINWLDGHRGLTEADKQDIIDQTDRIAELMRAIENEEDLPDYSNWANMEVVKDENGEKVLSVIVKNGDYAMNIDFSQVCKKRVALNAVLNAMVQSGDLNVHTLTETDVADLNAIIKEHEFEIACALCFVDSKRYRVGSWANSFCEGSDEKKKGKTIHKYGFNEMVRSLVPKGSKIKIDEFNFTNRDIENQPTTDLLSEADDSKLDFTLINEIMASNDPKSAQHRYAKAIKENPEIRKILNSAEIISSIGLDAIRLESPKLYGLINGHQGTAKPKFSHDVVAYGNDILKAKNFTAEKAKMVGGVRCQSFSDFMANMVVDYAQFISELSAKELTSHTYTKEPLFVKLFGLTGMKINMSLVPKAIDMTPEQQKYFTILKDKNANKRSKEYKAKLKEYQALAENAGLDENGNYIWEDETFPYDIAMDIVVDPRYSANCGTIAVGISDKHILKLLADDRISMVIPYHKSGLNHEVAMMRDIALYNDYTNVQNTRFSNGSKLEGVPDFNFYGDLYGVDGKEGTHDPKKTAENYLKWCDEHNYIPKFEKNIDSSFFKDNPNYYKLLIDFRVYDIDGTYREQQPVRPIYPSNEEFKDLILNGVKDKNGKVYGGLKQQQGNADRLSAESQQIIDEYRQVLKDKYGKDVLKEKYSERVNDKETLDFLNNQETLHVYRAMQVIDGKLYPPMAAKVRTDDGKKELVYSSKIGVWEQATEHPELIKNGKFELDKANGSSIYAAYNPYIHTSASPLNDQFSSAYKRDNLVVVEGEIPVSELTSGYRAEFAKDAVGETKWHSGPVASKLKGNKARKVFLSRWFKPLRIVPDSEVASIIAKTLEGENLDIPYKVVTPSLRSELEKQGVGIQYSDRERHIVVNMSEEERYKILKDKKIQPQIIEIDKNFDIDFDYLENNTKKIVEEPLLRKLEELSSFRKYNSIVIGDIEFEFTKSNLRKSLNSQQYDYGGSKADFAKVILNLQKLLDNSILIETHTDKGRGTQKENLELKQVYVLLGAFEDKGFITPIQFEIKQYLNDDNRLYLVIALTKIELNKIKTGVMDNAKLENNQDSTSLLPVSDISISDLFAKINPIDKNFLKYLPSQFLNQEQIEAKNKALEIESKKYSKKVKENFSNREEFISTEEIYNLMGESEKLKRQNQILAEDVERLRERLRLESKVTNDEFFSSSQLLSFAGHLRNIANSSIDKKRLAEMLRDVTKVIHNLDKSGMTPTELFEEHLLPIGYAIASEGSGKVAVDESINSIFKEIRGEEIWLSESQKAELRYMNDGKWNNALFGKFKISNNPNKDLASKWSEWSKAYPNIFDADISKAEMGVKLLEIYDDLKNALSVEEEYNDREVAMHLAQEIYSQCWTFRPIKTSADRYTERIKKLTSEHRVAMDEMKQTFKDRFDRQKLVDDMYYGRRLQEMRRDKTEAVAKQRLADDMYYGRIINNIRKRDEMALDLAKKLGRERMNKYKDTAERKTRIQRITANALTLNRWLLKNSKDKHIPEVLKPVVVEFLQAIDFSSKRLLEKGVPTQKDISLYEALVEIQSMMKDKEIDDIFLEDFLGLDMDKEIKSMVESAYKIKETLGDNEFILVNMPTDQLESLDHVVRAIKHMVTKLNKYYTTSHSAGIADHGEKTVAEINKLGELEYQGKIKKVISKTAWENRTPWYAFRMFGENAMKVFESFMDGQDKIAYLSKEVLDFVHNLYTNTEARKWNETTFDFELVDKTGKKRSFTLSVPQMMSLYCLAKDEDAKRHMNEGGITITEIAEKKVAAVHKNIRVSEDDIKSITAKLNEFDKKTVDVADALQEFMNTRGSELGNEISYARWGVYMFDKKNYFPIKVSKGTTKKKGPDENKFPTQTSFLALLGKSFTKARNLNANQSIEIDSIFNVFSGHMADMIVYNAMALPVLDAYKWYNYTGKTKDGEEYGVHTSLLDAFGENGVHYFEKLISDINGFNNTTREKLSGMFFKNSKIASVAANLRVMLLQPTSFFRANAVIDSKYLRKGFSLMPKTYKNATEKAMKYCGIALWKSLGYIDVNIGRSISERIKHTETRKDKAVELSMKGAEFFDKLTWSWLWNACELEIRDKRPDLKVGSEEFFETVGKRLREVIYATQVVDSTLTRSETMRSPDGMDKMLTSFMSEPTLALNMVEDAFVTYSLDKRRMGKKEAVKKNAKRVARVLTAYTITNAVAALVEAGFDAFRDKEEKEKDLAYFMRLYFENFASDMGIIGKIPYAKELISQLRGFSSSRTDTQWMQSFVWASEAWGKVILEGESEKAPKAIKNTIRSISDISGLPLYNVYRDAIAAINLLTGEDLEEMFSDFFE